MLGNPRSLRGAMLLASCVVVAATARAEPPSGHDSSQDAAVPPLCTDKNTLRAIKKQYDFLETQGGGATLKEVTNVTEIQLGKPPLRVNQYATRTNYAVSSRSCEGLAVLSNGKTDPVAWRMDYLVSGQSHSINYDFCSVQHAITDPGCKSRRAGK